MKPHRVLVVDDDVDLRETIIELLEDAGYEAIGAANGAEALTALLAEDRKPCMIFLDLMMPIMDGETFREEQLKHPELAEIPVIAISAYRDVAERAETLGIEHIAKPIKLAELRERARRYCPDPDALA